MALALAVFFVLPAAAMYFAVQGGATTGKAESAAPRAQLTLDLVRTDGSRLGSGSYALSGRPRQSLPIGFLATPQSYTGQFEAGRLVVEGLPPMRAEVHLLLTTGERAEFVIELHAGENQHTLRF